jgi:hypothetical protein
VRPNDRPRRDAYIKKVSDKKRWINKADDLLRAASLLEPEVECIYRTWSPDAQLPDPAIREGVLEVYFMLVGYAFENLLKGVHVRRLTRGQKGNLISQAELPGLLKKHDVLWLAKQLKLDLNSLEVDLLKRLKEVIVWRGRYPVPTSHSEILPFRSGTNDLTLAKGLVAKFRRL